MQLRRSLFFASTDCWHYVNLLAYHFTLCPPVREFGIICLVACKHLTSVTNILKRYWKHICLTRPRRLVTFIYRRLRNILTYLPHDCRDCWHEGSLCPVDLWDSGSVWCSYPATTVSGYAYAAQVSRTRSVNWAYWWHWLRQRRSNRCCTDAHEQMHASQGTYQLQQLSPNGVLASAPLTSWCTNVQPRQRFSQCLHQSFSSIRTVSCRIASFGIVIMKHSPHSTAIMLTWTLDRVSFFSHL